MASVASSEMGLSSYGFQIIIFSHTCFLSHLGTCTYLEEIKFYCRQTHLIALVPNTFIIFNKLQIGDQTAIDFLFKMILNYRDVGSSV